MALLGVDIGTSGSKAIVFAADGTVLGSGHEEYDTLYRAPGLAELDSVRVFEAVCSCVRAAVAQAAAAGSVEIEAMSFASMGEAVVPVAADRTILGPSILGSDARGSEYVSRLTDHVSPVELYAMNPNLPGPAYTMPKLCWLKDHEPELYRRADLFLYWADCVPFLLGCDAVTNYTHANRSLLFDIRAERWSSELIDLSRLDRTKLADCVPTGRSLGRISAEGARRLGLSERPLVVSGAHDQCFSAVGAGAVNPGDAVCGMGTVECITPVYAEIPPPDQMADTGLNVEHHAAPDRYVSFIYNQAGLLVRWFRDVFAGEVRNDEGLYDRLLGELPPGPSSLLTLPYFQPTGAPFFIEDGCGVIAGLHPETERGRILKSILEGETFFFVESLSTLAKLGARTSELVATGGAARSDAWLQIKADILGIPIVRLENTEAGTLGAAIVAGVEQGTYRTISDGVRASVRRADRFQPDTGRTQEYAQWYALYAELGTVLRDLMRRIDRAQRE